MVGIDIVENRRIREILDRYGQRFLRKILTENEMQYVAKKTRKVETISGIFAAKEAFIKARKRKVALKEIEVLHEEGAPYIRFDGATFRNVSISHERDYSVSIVIIP